MKPDEEFDKWATEQEDRFNNSCDKIIDNIEKNSKVKRLLIASAGIFVIIAVLVVYLMLANK